MPNPPTNPPSQSPAAARAYSLSAYVPLDTQEVETAIRGAVLAKANELALLGQPAIRSLSLHVKVGRDDGKFREFDVEAIVEVGISPTVVTRMLGAEDEVLPLNEEMLLSAPPASGEAQAVSVPLLEEAEG